MLDILGISMKAGNFYRIQVKATEEMNKAWFDIIKKEYDEEYTSFEEAIEDSFYRSNDKGFLVIEIEIDVKRNTYSVVFYFDDYVELDVEFTNEDFNQCVDFINEWKDRLPDNEGFKLGDVEWYDAIPDDIPWK